MADPVDEFLTDLPFVTLPMDGTELVYIVQGGSKKALASDMPVSGPTIAAIGNKQPLNANLTAISALAATGYGLNFLTLTDAAAGRTALALGGSATLNVGTTAGTVAAGDDSRIVGSAQKAANLSDLTNPATARTNLGVAIGVNVQAYSATLTALSSASPNGVSLVQSSSYATMKGLLAISATDTTNGALGTGAIVLANGATMTGANISAAADPTTALGVATKSYVDSVAQGADPKGSVLCATTVNITLAGEQTIDGVLTSSSRVLVKNQTAPAQNGIYVTAGGAWTRSTDMDNWLEVPGASTFVEDGGQASTGWICLSKAGGTLGTTAITWTQSFGLGTYTAGTGLTLSGTQFALAGQALALNNVPTAADKLIYATGIGTFATTDFTGVARTLVNQTTQALMRTTGLGLTTYGSSLAMAATAAAAKTLLAIAVADVSGAAPTASPTFTGTDAGANLTRSGTGAFGGVVTMSVGGRSGNGSQAAAVQNTWYNTGLTILNLNGSVWTIAGVQTIDNSGWVYQFLTSASGVPILVLSQGVSVTGSIEFQFSGNNMQIRSTSPTPGTLSWTWGLLAK